MASRSWAPGVTSKSIRVFIQNSASNAPLTGLAFNSAGLTGYYFRNGDAASTAITLATMTVGTWATGGFKEIDATNMPGWYELGIPNAALATGDVGIHLRGATNMLDVPLEIQLTGVSLDLTTEANKVETGWSLQQALRATIASLAGKLSGGNTATNTVRDVTDSRNSLTYTVDANGNRTAVTYNN